MRRNLLLGVLVASVMFNLLLGLQALRRPSARAATSDTMIGKPAPEIYGHPINGPKVRLTSFNRPVVLYVISPGCVWCARNTANITALWRRRSGDHEFLGLSLREHGLQAYLEKYPLPFHVAVAESETVAAYKLGVTPSTLLISKDRTVLREWNGAWDRAVPTIQRLFEVELPGTQFTPDDPTSR